jgi:hypothetical protein
LCFGDLRGSHALRDEIAPSNSAWISMRGGQIEPHMRDDIGLWNAPAHIVEESEAILRVGMTPDGQRLPEAHRGFVTPVDISGSSVLVRPSRCSFSTRMKAAIDRLIAMV